jgi:hypothetical protein
VILLDNVSLQDRDLLGRLTQYFASLEQRIKEGQGWLIFSCDRQRSTRISRFMLDRLAERRPFVSYYHVPWRDFALNAYMLKVELRGEVESGTPAPLPPAPPGIVPGDRSLVERDIAGRVTRDQFYQMRFADVLLLSGLMPAHPHEVEHLDSVMGERLMRRLPTLVLTPRAPHQLVADFGRFAGGEQAWSRLYDGMYSSSLIAL